MKVNFNRIIIPTSRESLLNLFTKFIQCKICMNLLNDPHDCLCCSQTFCKSCIINYIKTNNKCPFSEFFENNKQTKDKPNINDLLNKIRSSSSNFAKITQSLKFYCQNNDKGCNAELNIEEISDHEKICKYKMKKIKVELNNKNKNILNSTIRRKEKNLDLNYNNINNVYDDKYQSFDSNNDLLQLNKNNEIKHQDSVVSFSGIKNLSENKDINQFYLNENNINNIFNNSKLEKIIEEINQKLSYINNFIINNYDYKVTSTNDKSKSNKSNDISDSNKTENNKIEESKVLKNNSMTITNNFYDGSYINTVNNFTNENLDKNNCFNTINNNIGNNIDKISDIDNQTITVKFKQKQNKHNKEEDKNKDKEKDKKSNKVVRFLKSRKNTFQFLVNSKHKKVTKNKVDKKIEQLQEPKNKEKLEIKEKIILKNQIINNISNATPKLGGKAQSLINGIKPFDLKLNLNFDTINKSTNNINNNSICAKSLDNSNLNLNEDIFNGIKSLNCKITDIERLLQSNNSFKNQAYSIQNEDLFGDMQNDDSNTKGTISIKSSAKEIQNLKKIKNINIEKKENNESNIFNEEKKENKKIDNVNDLNKEVKKGEISINFEEIISKIETNFKNALKEKFDGMKKYIEEQCMEDIKKSVLDTNFDIMTLCTEKLDEFEKVLNKKFNNLKL